MKTQHAIAVSLTLMAAIVAVEAFYRHRTYGRGMSALIAVASAAVAFGPPGS
jgi:hypothetical protein